jgi:hypothetical protein
MLAHHNRERVRLIWRRGVDWGDRFPFIVVAVEDRLGRSVGQLARAEEPGHASVWPRIKASGLRTRTHAGAPSAHISEPLVRYENRPLHELGADPTRYSNSRTEGRR